MMIESIVKEWAKQPFKPIYWFEGEEEYYIDKAVAFAEHQILNEAEQSFNLSVFYGRDANWPDIINACKRYPMFAEKQVVILKEAQHLKDIEKLESYIENPLLSTLLVVAYKDKKVDGRTKFAKLIKEKGVLHSTKKMYDNQLPDWAKGLINTKGLSITPKALALLIDHIGNDLPRIENEIDKLSVNLDKRKEINEDDIEKFIGISKEFNVFELQNALAQKNMSKAIRIVQYFDANPKAAPIQVVLPALYSFFSKVFMLLGSGTADDKTIATTIGVNAFFLKDYKQAATLYQYDGVEKIILLLHQYNLKSIGIGSIGSADGALLKEMILKINMLAGERG